MESWCAEGKEMIPFRRSTPSYSDKNRKESIAEEEEGRGRTGTKSIDVRK
jgi:hypothetical protein